MENTITKIYRKNCDPTEIHRDQLERDPNVLPLKNTLTTLINEGFDCDKGVFTFRGNFDKVLYQMSSFSDSKNLFVCVQVQDR